MLNNVSSQIVTDQVGVPPVGGQKALHPVGSGVAGPLGQLPAVLALHRTQQTPQVVQCPPARLRTLEPPGNALMHLLDALGPPGHLYHLNTPCHHRHTSSSNSCLI